MNFYDSTCNERYSGACLCSKRVLLLWLSILIKSPSVFEGFIICLSSQFIYKHSVYCPYCCCQFSLTATKQRKMILDKLIWQLVNDNN